MSPEQPENQQENSQPSMDMATEVAALRQEIKTLNSHRFVRVHNSLWRLFALRFTMGLFTGLGTVIGATVLVSAVVYWLQGIEWVPLIGDWASQIAEQIELNIDTNADATEE